MYPDILLNSIKNVPVIGLAANGNIILRKLLPIPRVNARQMI
jgi:hypothetical protein